MILFSKRRVRESIIVSTMIRIYCAWNHGTSPGLCPRCAELDYYTKARLDRCMFGERKPVCKKCPVHCYSPSMREYIREVMRWSGPKMMFRHPLYATIHIIDTIFAPEVSALAKANSNSSK
jgi:hypothetical protein